MTHRMITKQLFKKLMDDLPLFWDGKKSILFMKNNNGKHWKQMEWPGWYFEFMCERILSKDIFFDIPGKRYGNTEFDGFNQFNFDFKCHSNNSSSKSKVITNARSAINQAIAQHGKVGFIVACGDAEYDDDQTFKQWHDRLKGKKTPYTLKREREGKSSSRRRKRSFTITKFVFYFLDKNTITLTTSFQANMKNSDGSLRNEKVEIDLNDSRFEKYEYLV